DDGASGTAYQYDIRYSTSEINDDNWNSATQADGEPNPQTAGSNETFIVEGLNPGTTYYFAIKTADEVSNWSGLSNVVSTTTDLGPPSPVGASLDTTNNTATLRCSQLSVPISIYYQFALDTLASFVSEVYHTGTVSGSEVQATYNSLRDGERYYWRCRVIASDHSNTSAWSSINEISFAAELEPPSLVGADIDTANASAELICTQVSTSVDIYYQFALDTLESCQSAQYQIGSLTDSVVKSTFTELRNQTMYYWRCRVVASDQSNTSTWSVTKNFRFNNTPEAPTPQSPLDSSVVETLQPTFIVLNSSDLDGDNLTYDFRLYDESSEVLLSMGESITEGDSVTQWTVPLDLVDSVGYTWCARCYDGEAYSQWTPMIGFTVNLGIEVNNPPTMPVHYSPQDTSTITTASIILVVENAVDPEDDSLSYDFRIYRDSMLTQLVENQSNVSEGNIKTSVTLDFTPVDGRSYWWQVRATDGENVTEYTQATWFKYVDLIASGEETVAGTSRPTDGEVILTNRPVLTAVNAATEGPNSYFFEIATDPEFVDSVAISSAIPEDEGGFTSWRVVEKLESDRDYFWRVHANDYNYSPVSKFHVAVDVYAFPNPVHLGEEITFNLPEEPHDLLILTVSGETVIIKEGLCDEWKWELNNSTGNKVAVGIYLWYLTGTDAHGKIVVKP
ncbi:MAG: hypothetical protein U9N55_00090, partial [candidate division Zixibacteria bacterium]|nr:hypothetical protein [candidate division Zixibacteria bacterium]